MAQAVWIGLAVLLMALSGAWGALAIAYQAPGAVVARKSLSALWCLLVVVAMGWLVYERHGWPLLGYLLALTVLLLWWRSITPSNDRAWADDVARMLSARIDGNHVTLHNVRNFNWRSDDDYDVRWETRHYDLDQLISADAVVSYWSRRAIAHAMISFGFADGRHLVFSVEIRKRRGHAFSEIGGFFKQFERILIAADERDIVRVRTNVRGEDDYLYALRMSRVQRRALFVSYLDEANRRLNTPVWYHTLTSNCTTIVYRMARQIAPGLPLDYRLLATGYLPQYLYAIGALDTRQPLDALTRQARITERARASHADEDFSAAIRRTPAS
jgi:hypothetical protein